MDFAEAEAGKITNLKRIRNKLSKMSIECPIRTNNKKNDPTRVWIMICVSSSPVFIVEIYKPHFIVMSLVVQSLQCKRVNNNTDIDKQQKVFLFSL